MKKTNPYKILLMSALIAVSGSVFAQVKIGDNPTTINPGSVLDLESTNKGLLMPRVSLTNTTTWGLLGTATAGMHVYNINTGINSTNVRYPILDAKIGEYYWDGTGWVALGGSQVSPVQVKIVSASGSAQQIPGNTNNVIAYANTIFDVNANKVGNSVNITSSGLYEITASAAYTTTASYVGAGFGLRLHINDVLTEQFEAGQLGINSLAAGRIVTRLNAGDVAKAIFFHQASCTSCVSLLGGQNYLTVIKLSN